MKDIIFEQCHQHYNDIVTIRRDIHQHPELRFDVERTAGIAADALNTLGISVKTGIGKTGVVGDLEVSGATKRIALRADMDALPIQEQTDVPYKSKIDGKAHLCGHDAHTAMLIGTARILSHLKSSLKVNIRFIFQPCEEAFPGGAPAMIEDGVLDDVDEIYGIHVFPLYSVGQYATCTGPMLAQSDTFEITITGRGGHAAFPHLTVDPIVVGTQFVNAAQSIVSRNVDPLDSAVVSVTQFHGGDAKNVIPPSVTLGGTVRTLDKDVQKRVRTQLENLIAGIANAHEATYTFAYQEGCPVTYNHEPCVDTVVSSAKALVGKENVIFPIPPILGGEDFACYSEKIPACFVMVGAGNEQKGIVNMCHHPQFDIDETSMIYGMALTTSIGLMGNR
ncbi:MAG: amidohydrolase [Candidatus Poribacteria bacterium]|nr:amidohydrolase [Candidatus Poribacteria bacterium]